MTESVNNDTNATPLLNAPDQDIKLELSFQNTTLQNNNHYSDQQYTPPLTPDLKKMSSSFIQRHLSSQASLSNPSTLSALSNGQKIHVLKLHIEDFSALQIAFYPGFAEKNAFLGQFKPTKKNLKRKLRKHKKSNNQTPLLITPTNSRSNSNTFSNDKPEENNINNSYEIAITNLSRIPIGSRLRFINLTDCEDMSYKNIMGLLATELIQTQHEFITLQFEDVRYNQQKVKNSSGAVMAWAVKQQTLGVNFSKSIAKLSGNKYNKCNCDHITHSCVRDIVDSWYITLLVFVVIIYDLSIIFYAESHRYFWESDTFNRAVQEENLITYLTLLALTLYIVEISWRIYGYGRHFIGTPIHLLSNNTDTNIESDNKNDHELMLNIDNELLLKNQHNKCNIFKYIGGYLTRGWIEFIDSMIVIISFLVTIIDIIFIDSGQMLPFLSMPLLYELLRFVRIIFRVICKLKYIPKCIRLIVRINRQTYFDEKFDLDLCYIVYPRYLVMSWPSQGIESLYRNPLKTVAMFLNKYHKENYLIFDLCKERSYDDILFHGRVMRARAMTDHSVCSLSDMFEFAQLVHLWLRHNPIHCAVIHCKGGKGRTGLMVCACLMYDYRETTVDEALEYFATMRTNITKGGKLQGVETPSQLRYCKYFYQLLHITDVLKIKQKQKSSQMNLNGYHRKMELQQRKISQSQSDTHSQHTQKFYNLVIAASPKDYDSMAPLHDDDDGDDEKKEEKEEEDDMEAPPMPQEQKEQSPDNTRIIDDHTRLHIAKHLDSEDLNISGLKQSKKVERSFRIDSANALLKTPELHAMVSHNSSDIMVSPKSRNSNVGLKTLEIENDKLYARGQWETSNPSLQSMLLLHQRFQTNIQNQDHKKSLNTTKSFTDLNKSRGTIVEIKKPNNKKKKKHVRQKSVTEVWLERQRDSTVIAQSLAKSKPISSSLMAADSFQSTAATSPFTLAANTNNDEKKRPTGLSVYDLMKLDDDAESKGYFDIYDNLYDDTDSKQNQNVKQKPNSNLQQQALLDENKEEDHYVSISNESYLSELFLKQPVVMKLKYVSIGPFTTGDWNNKSIYWKIVICMKRDFDYCDEMKTYEFTYYKVDEHNFHRMMFHAFDNLSGGRSSLILNGNICIKIYRCKRDDIIHDKKIREEFGDEKEKNIGAIWIHSHFIPANYEKKVDVLIFRKSQIDTMYKDKKHRTAIPHSFTVEIGYRCSRLKKDKKKADDTDIDE